MNKKTAVIIVTYQPDIIQLEMTIRSIIFQTDCCFIINNGIESFCFSKEYKNLSIINLGKNYGIAYAQNRGLELAKQYNADFIILSDQDTIYPENYVQRNVAAYEELKGHKLAALVPVFYDLIKQKKEAICVKKFSAKKNSSKKYIKTAQAIASGSFIVASSLTAIGGMDERLFIDWVDIEWCWRATAMGYEIFTITDLVINHRLGDAVKKIFGRQFTTRSDIRYYYTLRNACYLARYSKFLKWFEKLFMYNKVIKLIISIILIKHNIQCIIIIRNAILDGFYGRLN